MAVNMSSVLGLVFANMHDKTIEDLTKNRTMGSVMFGGRYRLIDFPLSNMVNSGMAEVGVIAKSNYLSLIDHIGSGAEWDLSRKKGGLHILTPFSNAESVLYRGRLEAMQGAVGFIKASAAEYVVLADCDIVTNMDFRPILEKHVATGADITAVAHTGIYTLDDTRSCTVFASDESGRIHDVLINPLMSGACSMSLNMFVMRRDFLLEILKQAAPRSLYSFEKDILQSKCREFKIYTYEYDGYYSKISNMKNYYEANYALLNFENCKKLFAYKRPIYTKVRDNAPSKYGLDSSVKRSLIADGCEIKGDVENCVIFRGVKIGKGSKIRNCILMQGTIVGDGVEMTNVITDKNVNISENRLLSGSVEYPMFIGKGASI